MNNIHWIWHRWAHEAVRSLRSLELQLERTFTVLGGDWRLIKISILFTKWLSHLIKLSHFWCCGCMNIEKSVIRHSLLLAPKCVTHNNNFPFIPLFSHAHFSLWPCFPSNYWKSYVLSKNSFDDPTSENVWMRLHAQWKQKWAKTTISYFCIGRVDPVGTKSQKNTIFYYKLP